METYRVRFHFRVMNRGQWDNLKQLKFSEEAQEILENDLSKIDGRSLIIDKTISFKGFLFISPFFEIIGVIRNNLGECLCIADYVNQSNSSLSAYVCEVGDISESETSVRSALSAASISNIEEWMKARGKPTPQSAIALIQSFYGDEPQPTMQGPWSIEKEFELRHNVFSKATFDEIVAILKANLSRMNNILGGVEKSALGLLSVVMIAGKIGAANRRPANRQEKALLKSFMPNMPKEFFNQLVPGIEGEVDLDNLEGIVNTGPQLCPSILDMIFCFIYADGIVESIDYENLEKIAPIFSMPMSAFYMGMQFVGDIPNPPIDYAAYVSGVDNDTVAYMAGFNGFMNVNLDGENTGVRMVSSDWSDNDHDDDEDDDDDEEDDDDTNNTSKPEVNLSNEEIEKILSNIINDDKKYSTQMLQKSDKNISRISIQKLNAILRKMTQNGSLTKVEENNRSYYSCTKIWDDKREECKRKVLSLLKGKKKHSFKELAFYLKNNSLSDEWLRNLLQEMQEKGLIVKAGKGSNPNYWLLETLDSNYNCVVEEVKKCKTVVDYSNVISKLNVFGDYRDAKQLLNDCQKRKGILESEQKEQEAKNAENKRKQAKYDKALEKMESNSIIELEQAAKEMESLSGWKDADEQAIRIREKIKRVKRLMTVIGITGLIAFIAIIIVFMYN